MTHVAFPLAVDATGRTATVGDDGHVRGLIEQVLFTAPGERVNRPEFGSGVSQLVFAPNADVLAATVEVTVAGALQRWLGRQLDIGEVTVSHAGATLTLTVSYTVRATGRRATATFERPAP